jgi:hypothetical protein
MARGKNGRWSKYRNARDLLTDLEAQREKRLRMRPRTRGKKAAKTRALNQLARKIRAAKGALTKARNAISRAAAERKVAKSTAKLKRSAAATKGWAKRKAARQATAYAVTSHAETSLPGRRMRFLEERDGVAVRVEVAPPDRADRSAIGSYWYAVGVFRDNGSTTLLRRFEDRSIYDGLRQERLPFVTDPTLLLEAIAAGLTDFDDLYIESNWSSAA